MSEIRLIGVDLDGTALDSQKRISGENVRVFRECRARGIEIVPVTGRPASGIYAEHIDAIGCRYTINTNGAAVIDRLSGDTVIAHTISPEKALEICSLLNDFDCYYSVFNGGYGYLSRADYQRELRKWEGTPLHRYIQITRRAVDSQTEFIGTVSSIDNIYVTAATNAERERIRAEIDKVAEIFYTCSASDDVEIGGMCSKGSSLIELAESLGIKRGEVMAIGDSGNDLSMLEHAGLAVAMGNASDEIKKAADFITKTCEESGVAYAIEKLALHKC